MALPISMFTKGVLITTPPLIYIFVGDIPMNSLVGDVNSASQESDMRSDDPNALPLDGSNTLSPTTENSLENKALPSSDPVVDDGKVKESDPGVTTDEPVVDSGDVKDTNPKVSEGVSQESLGVSKGSSQESVPLADDLPKVDDEPTGGGDRAPDGLPAGNDETDDDESTGDPSKNDELNKKLKEAGIDDSCFLPNLKTVGKCTLTQEQLERINFPQREDEDDTEFQISGLGEDEKVTLTIESGYDEDDFPEGGLRLTFHNPNSKEVKITGDGNSDASLMPSIDHDYMFSIDTDKWIDKAWSSLQKLGDKVGLNINNVLSDDSCTAGNTQNKINVWKSRKEYVIGADKVSDSTCPMQAEENVSNLLEGFKLKVKEEKDVPLSGGKGPSGGKTINALKKDAFYSFAPKRVEGKKVWFLIEKSQ